MPDDEGLREELWGILLAHRAIGFEGHNLRCACGWVGPYLSRHQADQLSPVVERYAARRAAEALRPVRELFAGGPDTACRTRFRWDLSVGTPTSLECVEVPMDDLRDALARADALAADGTEPHPAHRHDETEAGS